MNEDPDLDRLKLAARRLDDLFELPLPDAPGYAFVGGRLSVVSPANGREYAFSVGGADAERPRAFRRCVGEAAETLSQFAGLLPDEQRFASSDAAWLPASRFPDGSSSPLAATLCYRDLYGSPEEGMSLGCAAGRSLDEATASAVLELIERDALALWWEGGAPASLPAPEIADVLQAEVGRMRAGADTRRATWFLDITSDLDVPVIAALSCGADGRGLAAGFAAGLSPEAAGRAALRELAQTELGNRLVAAKLERAGDETLLAGTERAQLSRMRLEAASDARLRPASAARTHAPAPPAATADPLTFLGHALAGAGVDVLAADLTNPALGVPVVKAVAPALQAYPPTAVTARLARSREIHGLDASSISLPRIV